MSSWSVKKTVANEVKEDIDEAMRAWKINLPLVILTGHNTASSAEDFLVALDGLEISTIVGEKTFGNTGQPLFFKLPGGGSARICTKRDEYPDGKEFVGYGIQPDILVERTLEDFLANRDIILEKGIKALHAKQFTSK